MRDGIALARAIRGRALSAREACEEALARAEADDLGSLWVLAPERALADADSVDARLARGDELGPLAGVPLAVKDCFDVAGLATTVGIASAPPPEAAAEDAEAVERLRHAGAVVVGKAAMHQLAWGMSGQAPGFPPCRNPVDPTRMPGGSSSGSAVAVARGIVPLGLGTDSGGSVRQPAAWCELVGFKPALGAVPLGGCAPMAQSLDTCGVLARSVRDCRSWLEDVTGARFRSGAHESARVGVLASAFEGVEGGVERSCKEALDEWRRAGARLVGIELPWERRILGSVYAAELAAAWGDKVDAHSELFGADIRSGIATGRAVAAVDYVRALNSLERIRVEAAVAARSVDVVASPTTPILPPALGDPDPVVLAGRNTRIFNGLGWPAITVPCRRVDGLPVGVQLAARPGHEFALLALAERLEAVLAATPVASA